MNIPNVQIEFDPEGIILGASDLFVKAMKYTNEKEFIGQHHRIFCDAHYVKTREYDQFWSDLRNGFAQVGEFRRIARDGSDDGDSGTNTLDGPATLFANAGFPEVLTTAALPLYEFPVIKWS